MDVSEIKVGMKVAPHSKSIGVPLEDSISWNRCWAKGLGYLYVVSLEGGCIACSDDPSDAIRGDWFEAKDLEPYDDREEYVCSIPGVTAELIPGEKYFVSNRSEAEAKVSSHERVYVCTIGGRHYFATSMENSMTCTHGSMQCPAASARLPQSR